MSQDFPTYTPPPTEDTPSSSGYDYAATPTPPPYEPMPTPPAPPTPPPMPAGMPGAPEKKSNKTLIIILVIAAVLLLCCCCVIVGALGWTYGDQLMQEIGAVILFAVRNALA